jgi:hypothetical protein
MAEGKMELKIGRPAGEITFNLDNHGTVNKNTIRINSNNGGVDLHFSYDTLVGVDRVISENEWSVTTGKFLNELQPDKSRRVPHEQVLKEAQERLKQVVC